MPGAAPGPAVMGEVGVDACLLQTCRFCLLEQLSVKRGTSESCFMK